MNRRSFAVIAHNIRSIYNVGSIFRSADAFGIEKIYLTGFTGAPPHPRLKKTALGAQNTVAWQKLTKLKPLLSKLKKQGTKVVALENKVRNTALITDFRPHFPLVLLLGEETNGIKKNYLKLCDQILEIPMLGTKESLNVAVAFGIAAFYITNHQQAKP